MRLAATVAAVLVLSTHSAPAHVVLPGVGGFPGGLVHPLLVLSHALALVALGLLAGAQPARGRCAVIALFVAAMALSFGGVSAAYSTDRAELAVLALAAATGLLLASGWNMPFAVTALIAIGLGSAILFDSVPAVPTVRETLLALAGTTLAAAVSIGTIAFVSAWLPALWQRIGIRVAGSWIAASAILVLALRLAKL